MFPRGSIPAVENLEDPVGVLDHPQVGVTMMPVLPRCFDLACQQLHHLPAEFASRAAVGSSTRIRSGSFMSARPMATAGARRHSCSGTFLAPAGQFELLQQLIGARCACARSASAASRHTADFARSGRGPGWPPERRSRPARRGTVRSRLTARRHRCPPGDGPESGTAARRSSRSAWSADPTDQRRRTHPGRRPWSRHRQRAPRCHRCRRPLS